MYPVVVLLSLLYVMPAQAVYPGYTNFVKQIENAKTQLNEQLLSMDGNIPNITDPRRHYAVFVTHFWDVATEMAWNCSAVYDDVYIKKMPTCITNGLMNVNDIIYTVQQEIILLDNKIKKMTSLINTMCPETISPFICNIMIHRIVKGDPMRYKEPAEVLSSTGRIAQEFVRARLIPLTKSYVEIPYMIEKIDVLRDLVLAAAEHIRYHLKLCVDQDIQ